MELSPSPPTACSAGSRQCRCAASLIWFCSTAPREPLCRRRARPPRSRGRVPPAVALHQGSVPLASVVILRAFPDKVVQSRRIEAQSPPAEGDVLPAAEHKDVDVIRGKGLKAGLHFLRAGWNQV